MGRAIGYEKRVLSLIIYHTNILLLGCKSTKKATNYYRLSQIFLFISHQQVFELRYFYPSPVQFEETCLLHTVEGS